MQFEGDFYPFFFKNPNPILVKCRRRSSSCLCLSSVGRKLILLRLSNQKQQTFPSSDTSKPYLCREIVTATLLSLSDFTRFFQLHFIYILMAETAAAILVNLDRQPVEGSTTNLPTNANDVDSWYFFDTNVAKSGDEKMCETCGKRFTKRAQLNRHQLSHDAVRRFPCPFSLSYDDACAVYDNLGVDAHWHSDGWRVKCDKAFARRDNMLQHYRYVNFI
jgi:hypothetical protein